MQEQAYHHVVVRPNATSVFKSSGNFGWVDIRRCQGRRVHERYYASTFSAWELMISRLSVVAEGEGRRTVSHDFDDTLRYKRRNSRLPTHIGSPTNALAIACRIVSQRTRVHPSYYNLLEQAVRNIQLCRLHGAEEGCGISIAPKTLGHRRDHCTPQKMTDGRTLVSFVPKQAIGPGIWSRIPQCVIIPLCRHGKISSRQAQVRKKNSHSMKAKCKRWSSLVSRATLGE